MLATSAGPLRPRSEAEYPRRPEVDPVTFHPNGRPARISITATPIPTPAGVVPAELVLFHENGQLRRVFPQDGSLDGFWSESQERELAPAFGVPTPVGELHARFIALAFYPSGGLFSLTLWPDEAVQVSTPIGPMAVRVGVSFFENGQVRSVEPKEPTPVETPIGPLTAFDPNPVGVNGDQNSLEFGPDGRVVSLVTSVETLIGRAEDGTIMRFTPDVATVSMEEDWISRFSLEVHFAGDRVRIKKDRLAGDFDRSNVRVERPAHASRRHLSVLR